YQRTRRMLTATLDLNRWERVKRVEGLNVIKERVGHLHEQVIRNAISLAYGPDWGTDVMIRGFTDAISFVSDGISKSPLQRQAAHAVLIKRFCKGLNNFDFRILPDYENVTNSNDPDRLKLEQET